MTRKLWFLRGMKAGVPIMLGYFAVSLALGITAAEAGFSPLEATVTSFLINASAGEYIGFTLIAAGAGYFEVMLMEAIANARYLLMSASLSQKLDPKTSTAKRLLLGFDVTDEIFGISVSVDGKLDPFYSFGAMVLAIPGWSLGTLCGALLGNVLPLSLISALGVGLYGMFISVFVPEAKKNRIVCGLVLLGFATSFAVSKIPLFDGISEGIKIIALTVILSLGAAILFPIREEERHDA